jgi:hypothetical protein
MKKRFLTLAALLVMFIGEGTVAQAIQMMRMPPPPPRRGAVMGRPPDRGWFGRLVFTLGGVADTLGSPAGGLGPHVRAQCGFHPCGALAAEAGHLLAGTGVNR